MSNTPPYYQEDRTDRLSESEMLALALELDAMEQKSNHSLKKTKSAVPKKKGKKKKKIQSQTTNKPDAPKTDIPHETERSYPRDVPSDSYDSSVFTDDADSELSAPDAPVPSAPLEPGLKLPYPFLPEENGGVPALKGFFNSASLFSLAPGCVIPAPESFNSSLELPGYSKASTLSSSQDQGQEAVEDQHSADIKATPKLNFPTVTYKLPFLDRKFLSLPKWHCIPRPQYKAACGITSLTAVFNYLFSVLGVGALPPLSTEQVMALLGFLPPFDQIHFGRFTGNDTLMRWFQRLVDYFGVSGQCSYLWKANGQHRTPDVTPESALQSIKEAVRSDNDMLIYHWFVLFDLFFHIFLLSLIPFCASVSSY